MNMVCCQWHPQKEREDMSKRMRRFLEMADVISFLGEYIAAVMKRLQVGAAKKREMFFSTNEAERKERRYWKFVERHQGQEAFVTWIRADNMDEAFSEFCKVSHNNCPIEINLPGSFDQMLRKVG
jgi:hypothetical protein